MLASKRPLVCVSMPSPVAATNNLGGSMDALHFTEKALQIIPESKGSRFDPDVGDAFAEINGQFKAVAMRFANSDFDMAPKQKQLETFTNVSE